MSRFLLALVASLALAGCGQVAAQVALDKDVDRITVDKARHTMSVYRGGMLLKTFPVALGRGGPGPKAAQGDGKVPEGKYRITGRNPDSAYHLSLRIGYPNEGQRAAAVARGVDPGDDIMIHGLPNGRGDWGAAHRFVDWTDGCIAVTDDEIEELWKHVPDGTPIDIKP
jgi:murein L,D-transpeptidase YafK